MDRPTIDRNFQNKVDRELIALINLVDRNFPTAKTKIRGWQELLLITMETCKTTYATTKYIAADSPREINRDLKFVLTVPLLNRLLADLLFIIIFICQKPSKYCKWFHQAGWRELAELIEKYTRLRTKPKNWNSEIQRMKSQLDYLSRTYHIPRKKITQLKDIDYWPIPSQMIKTPKWSNKKTYTFLNFLYLWIYRDLSQHSHFSGSGIVRMYSVLLLEEDQGIETALQNIKWKNFLMATTLVLALCTEVNQIGNFNRNSRLSYLWTLLVNEFAPAEDLYKKRYKALLK
jgi:hypothetical protein